MSSNTQDGVSTNAPRCTVIVPNYNNSNFIKSAISSITSQKYPNKQIIVVDDASQDDSVDTLLRYLDGYDKQNNLDNEGDLYIGKIHNIPIGIVKLYKNGGPSRARNIGIKLAWDATQIYANLDSDDYWIDGKMEKCIEPFVKFPGIVGAVYTDYCSMNTKSGLKIQEYKEPFSRERIQERCIVHSGAFFSKEALGLVYDKDTQQFYDEEMRTAEDWDLWLRISDHRMIYHIPEPLTVARVHNNNSFSMYGIESWQENWKRIAQKRRKLYEQIHKTN